MDNWPNIPPSVPSSDAQPSSPLPLLRQERRIHGDIWIPIDHTANCKRGSKVSAIWEHGGEYVAMCDPMGPHRWVCDHCNSAGRSVVLQQGRQTSNIIRHLRTHHKIDIVKDELLSEADDEGQQQQQQGQQQVIPVENRQAWANLFNPVDIDSFRKHLIEWVVAKQVPFYVIESDRFRALLVSIQPSLTRYLPTAANTLSNWVQAVHSEMKIGMKKVVKEALSKVHISFDIWTSPNCKPVLAVNSHFLGRDSAGKLAVQSVLLDMVEVFGAHDGANIAKSVMRVLDDWELSAEALGISVSDNAKNNDTAVKAWVKEQFPGQFGVECITGTFN